VRGEGLILYPASIGGAFMKTAIRKWHTLRAEALAKQMPEDVDDALSVLECLADNCRKAPRNNSARRFGECPSFQIAPRLDGNKNTGTGPCGGHPRTSAQNRATRRGGLRPTWRSFRSYHANRLAKLFQPTCLTPVERDGVALCLVSIPAMVLRLPK
jgi:hypothetical protein